MPEPGGTSPAVNAADWAPGMEPPKIRTADELIVAREVEALRARSAATGGVSVLPGLQADLLAAAPVELAARFLREMAMRALDGRFPLGGQEEWAVSAVLQAEAHRERRAGGSLHRPAPRYMTSFNDRYDR